MMPAVGFLSRVVLGAVFIVAGVGKLLDHRATRDRSIEYIVVPRPLAGLYGRVLPLLELGTGLLLVAGSLFPLGATLSVAPFYAAAGLLTAFSAAIAVVLARGQAAVCHCFGRFGGGRVTWWTLARNLALLLLAGAGPWFAHGSVVEMAHAVARAGVIPTLILTLATVAISMMVAEGCSLVASSARSADLWRQTPDAVEE